MAAADASGPSSGQVWQDKEIRLFLPAQAVMCRKGEFVIDRMNSVEDTKGNNGTRGTLLITNLRMVWISHKSFKTNLSVGYSCIQTITIRSAPSILRARAQALYLMTKFDEARYEFIFTSLVEGSPRLFTTVQAVFRAYETSKLYRDLKLRGAIVRDGLLRQLPDEEVFNRLDGVMNLSSDQGNLGVLYLTNIRMVWHASLAENFNVSNPLDQISKVHVRASTLLLFLALSGRREAACKEVSSLWKVFLADPVLGVKHTVEDAPTSTQSAPLERRADDVEIVDSAETSDTMAAYLADASKAADREPVFDPELGLAVEALPPGYDIGKLWSA
ncbi:hypothetical protein FNF28_07832 [Cafeteria roenbergensis]|uniref:BBSome complex member BBS5 PH domain-containing protein n=1 Tax=Cafeteria roenbergensis TaxID=33653 RepID=A0A5A8BZ77_CAFRO|nr:hypothetical protein FNF28_07832 [Cafeteria roenbergensis]